MRRKRVTHQVERTAVCVTYIDRSHTNTWPALDASFPSVPRSQIQFGREVRDRTAVALRRGGIRTGPASSANLVLATAAAACSTSEMRRRVSRISSSTSWLASCECRESFISPKQPRIEMRLNNDEAGVGVLLRLMVSDC